MADFFLRGLGIGLLFGVPVGAIGVMTVQRTWEGGVRAGLFTGMGASAADCFYACIGAFGLVFLSDFLLRYQVLIRMLGGGFLTFMGIRLLLRKNHAAPLYETENTGGIKLFFSSFLVGITNPAAILTFLFAYSWFGVEGDAGAAKGLSLVIGVFVGTYIWWGMLSLLTGIMKKRAKKFAFAHFSRLFGSLLCLFAAVVFGQLIFG